MARIDFQPRVTSRIGAQISHLQAGNSGAISPVAVASNTVVYKIPTPRRASYIETANWFIGVLPTGSSTITIQLFRRNSVGAVSQALTAAVDMKTGSINTGRAFAITASEQNRYLQEGDYLAYDIVAAGTITLQPSDVQVAVELAVKE